MSLNLNFNSFLTKDFIITLTLNYLVFIIPELICRNCLIFIIGGLIGGSISELISGLGIEDEILTFSIWILVLILFINILFRLKMKGLLYTIFFVVAILLYVFDLLLMNYLPVEIARQHYMLFILVSFKAILFTFIITLKYKKTPN